MSDISPMGISNSWTGPRPSTGEGEAWDNPPKKILRCEHSDRAHANRHAGRMTWCWEYYHFASANFCNRCDFFKERE